MKPVHTFLIFLCLAVVALVATKPTDQECINQVRNDQRYTGLEAVLNEVATNRYSVQIEDHIFYKTIYSRVSGQQLGTGIFGTVILSK